MDVEPAWNTAQHRTLRVLGAGSGMTFRRRIGTPQRNGTGYVVNCRGSYRGPE